MEQWCPSCHSYEDQPVARACSRAGLRLWEMPTLSPRSHNGQTTSVFLDILPSSQHTLSWFSCMYHCLLATSPALMSGCSHQSPMQESGQQLKVSILWGMLAMPTCPSKFLPLLSPSEHTQKAVLPIVFPQSLLFQLTKPPAVF